MSTSPYSLDLRSRVISFVKSGNSERKAAKIYNLHRSTVNRWCVRYKKEGHFLPRKRIGAKSKIKQSEFVDYLATHPDVKLVDLATYFKISVSGIFYWLRKLGYRYKKNSLPTWKQKKKTGTNISF